MQIKSTEKMTPQKMQYIRKVTERFFPVYKEKEKEKQWKDVKQALGQSARKISMMHGKGRFFEYDEKESELRLIN